MNPSRTRTPIPTEAMDDIRLHVDAIAPATFANRLARPSYFDSLYSLRATRPNGICGYIAPLRLTDCVEMRPVPGRGNWKAATFWSSTGPRLILVPAIMAELAILDLTAKEQGVPVYRFFGRAVARKFQGCLSLVGLELCNEAPKTIAALCRKHPSVRYFKVSLSRRNRQCPTSTRFLKPSASS